MRWRAVLLLATLLIYSLPATALTDKDWFNTTDQGFEDTKGGDYKGADAQFQKAFEIAKQLGAHAGALQIRSLMLSAAMKERQGNLTGAADTYKKAIDLAPGKMPKGADEYPMLLGCYAEVLRKMHRDSEAVEVDKQRAEARTQSLYIGSAWMLPDGTIEMELTTHDTMDGKQLIGHAFERYLPTDPNYQKILNHLPGLTKGKMVRVPAWKEEPVSR